MHEPTWFFWLYLAAWVVFTACLALYGIRSPWWETVVGRGLLGLYGSIVAILTLVLIVQLIGVPRPLLDVLRVLTLGGVFLAGLWQVKNIVKLQQRRSAEPRHPRRRADDV